TRIRGAASPRSASPIGPAPTRLPRMALPLPTKNSFSVMCPGNGPSHAPQNAQHRARVPGALRARGAVLGLALAEDEQAERDDTDGPHQTGGDGQPVEVALDHRGAPQGGGDTAAEQIGEATTFALVEQDQHDHQHADDHQGNGQTDDNHTLTRNSTPTRGNPNDQNFRPASRHLRKSEIPDRVSGT